MVNGAGKALTNTLDAVGNRVGMVDGDGGLATYSWDASSGLTGIVNPYAEITTITLDALDREQKKTLGNGMIVSQFYDAAGTEISRWNVSGAGVGPAIYTAPYDAAGSRWKNVELDGTRVTPCMTTAPSVSWARAGSVGRISDRGNQRASRGWTRRGAGVVCDEASIRDSSR